MFHLFLWNIFKLQTLDISPSSLGDTVMYLSVFHSFSTYELFFLSKGFLPTYGPCWVNLYGSTRQYSLLNENQHLNDGLGEGVSYRGRMLISLRTEVIESADLGGPATVEVCSALPISDVSGLCINAWYIKYCKCTVVCCELYDGFFVRFSNCS